MSKSMLKKSSFNYNNFSYRTGEKGKVHVDFTMLIYIYNAQKLAVNRLNQQMHKMNQAVFRLSKRGKTFMELISIIIEIEMWVLI
ncbi:MULTISPECIES: hypothetical protein [unclassified Peribacillus]|uniref:hypothetical protein n=1 Tax=unclassified Peribacillus TaxID=2675266 RepID=UPI00366C7885